MRLPIKRRKNVGRAARSDLEQGTIAVVVLMALVLVAIGIGAVAEALSSASM